MDPMIVQRSRYVLKSRVTRARRCPGSLFQSACIQLIDWLQNHGFFGPMVARLEVNASEQIAWLAQVMEQIRKNDGGYVNAGRMKAKTLDEYAASCFAVVQAVVKNDFGVDKFEFVLQNLSEYLIGGDPNDMPPKAAEALETVRDVALEGLYEYLDEQVDSRNALISILLKYQHRSEWFRRKRLREIATTGIENEKGGERALAVDLQEYIFNQGIEFVIEPASASGAVDLMLRDSSDRHLVLDAKYVPQGASPSEIKRKLSHGFHQVVKYCTDFQEPAGYMILFKNDETQIVLPLEENDGLRMIRLGSVVAYYIEVAIADAPSASKVGKPTQVAVTMKELVEEIEEGKDTAGAPSA